MITTMLYILSPELVNLITGSWYPLANGSPTPPPLPLLTLIITDLLSVSLCLALLDSTYK